MAMMHLIILLQFLFLPQVQPVDQPGPQICFLQYDIHLGDSRTEVEKALGEKLIFNYEGLHDSDPNLNDYFLISDIFEVEDGSINPVIYCTFNKEDELTEFSVAYVYEAGPYTDAHREIFIRNIQEKLHPCISGVQFDLNDTAPAEIKIGAGYFETFKFKMGDQAYWHFNYTITY